MPSRDDWPVNVVPVFGCWEWTARVNADGYPVIWRRGINPIGAHVYVFLQEGGTIGPGNHLDHLCRNRLCVRPSHLEPVTRSENELRKSPRYRSRRKACPRGHEWPLNSIITPQGGKVCRVCNSL